VDNNNNRNSPDSDETGEVISWVIVFILMFAFPPVGILLLILKLRSNARRSSSRNSSGYYSSRAANAARQAAWEAEAATRHAARNAETAARNAAAQAGAAARETGDAVRSAAAQTGVAAKEAGEAIRNTAAQYKSSIKRVAPGVYTNASGYNYSYSPKKKEKKRKGDSLEKKTGRFLSAILLIMSIAMLIAGASLISSSVQKFLVDSISEWSSLIMGIFFFLGGLITFFSRNTGVKRLARYKKYYAFVGDRDIVRIPDIARAAGASVRVVSREVQTMIIDGYFGPGAYIDNELDSLVISPAAAKAAREAMGAESTAQEPPSATAEKPANQYMAIIIELRELNDTIIDIRISDQIDRIEELTAKIFRIVEENPDKQPQIRRFMNYYLPTTLKLLRSYATLEKQGIAGENISSTKESIGRILDTLAKGFEQQLDLLFKSDAIDIAADINVLENLMQQDGLTGEKIELKPELKVQEGSM